MEINKIYNCDCIDGLKQLESNSVDLTVTSPPYDNLRSYGDTLEWGFETFKPIAKELYRVTKPGGVVVWVVGDACIKGTETCSSFKQALYFVEECGFKLHDTMIYEKNGSSYPVKLASKRYTQIFEYMFVFVKGEIRKDITLIADKRNKWAGWTSWGRNTKYDTQGNMLEETPNKPIGEFSLRNNIWKYSVSFNDKTGHPAVFPEKLAEDHILSWTKEGDLVLDPFMGSGTTAKMAMLNNRNFVGFEKNTEYYEKSLERIGKYVGKTREKLSGATITDEDGISEDLQVNVDDDKELEGKTVLFNKLVEQLNQYFNEQSLGILKQLQFVFKSKSNDERVKKFYGDDTQEQQEQKVKENEMNEEDIIKTVEKYFGMKRLPEFVIELNQEARKRNLQRELDELNGVKPERKRRKRKVEEVEQQEFVQIPATEIVEDEPMNEPEPVVLEDSTIVTPILATPIEDNVVKNLVDSFNHDGSEYFTDSQEEENETIITNKRIRGYKVGNVALLVKEDGTTEVCVVADRKKTDNGNFLYSVLIHKEDCTTSLSNVTPEQLKHVYNKKTKCC